MFGLQKHIDRRNQKALEEQERQLIENYDNSGFDFKQTAIKATVVGVIGYHLGKKIGKL